VSVDIPPRNRRRLPASERRAVLLDAALEVFAERGYHRASIDDIAQAAGVSKALIYDHFASKKDLHLSLLEAQADELFDRLARATATDEPGEVRLRAGVDAFLAFVEERGEGWRALFRDAADPEAAAVLERLQAQATAAIAALIASEPGAGGRAHDRRVEMLAQLLSGTVQALANWWHAHPDAPREQLVTVIMDYAWLGLERLRAGERLPPERVAG
jgi:AcrR family transcriptional regulator